MNKAKNRKHLPVSIDSGNAFNKIQHCFTIKPDQIRHMLCDSVHEEMRMDIHSSQLGY